MSVKSPGTVSGLNAASIPGLKAQRVTTGAIGAGASAVVTVIWGGVAFPDANYTVIASVEDSTASTAALSVVHVETKVVGSVGVRVVNNAAGPLTGTLDCIAVHD